LWLERKAAAFLEKIINVSDLSKTIVDECLAGNNLRSPCDDHSRSLRSGLVNPTNREIRVRVLAEARTTREHHGDAQQKSVPHFPLPRTAL
jgi:hypothetical protein